MGCRADDGAGTLLGFFGRSKRAVFVVRMLSVFTLRAGRAFSHEDSRAHEHSFGPELADKGGVSGRRDPSGGEVWYRQLSCFCYQADQFVTPPQFFSLGIQFLFGEV